jgi:hypothetical protein
LAVAANVAPRFKPDGTTVAAPGISITPLLQADKAMIADATMKLAVLDLFINDFIL